jgi:ferredoxin
MVALDFDSCVADGACIEACHVQVFQWYRTEQDVPAIEMANATSVFHVRNTIATSSMFGIG